MNENLRAKWDQAPIFWKAYLLSALFVGGIVATGEFFEDVLGDWLYGASGLSELEEFYVWVLATIIPTALGSYLLTRLFTGSLRRLTTVTRQLAEGNLQARVAARDALRSDEMGTLARAFNDMAQRLDHAFENEHRLLAAISHELRSPLTRLSVTVALLRRQKADGQYLDRLELEAERMNALITQLLDYARRESEKQPPQLVNLCAIIQDVASDAAFEGSEDNKTVRLNLPACAEMYGNSVLLRQAVDNIVRNALRYSPPGGVVDILLNAQNTDTSQNYALQVRDYGPGVPEATLGDLFRPFFRVEPDRDRASGGTGMGLCIAEQAVRLHHGHIHAVNAAGGGLEIHVQLPQNMTWFRQ